MNFVDIKWVGIKDFLFGMVLEYVNGMNRRSFKVLQMEGCVSGRGDNQLLSGVGIGMCQFLVMV